MHPAHVVHLPLTLAPGVIAPMALLGVSMAGLVAPLTASVMSSVTDADEGLVSGVNNALSPPATGANSSPPCHQFDVRKCSTPGNDRAEFYLAR